MFIGTVRGSVVMSQKDDAMRDTRLVLIEPAVPKFGGTSDSAPKLQLAGKSLVAVDFVGAGIGDIVLVTQGSSARLTEQTNRKPVDAVVIGIVESIRVGEQTVSHAAGTLTV